MVTSMVPASRIYGHADACGRAREPVKTENRTIEIVEKANRNADIFARYGGEEFIILAPSTDIAGARVHAERLRNDIEHYRFTEINHLTCSFGVAEINREKDDVSTIMKRADAALYNAKAKGRNCVIQAEI